ncbi:hypothetical protein EON63_22520 [archaeon]|nr:MAG: hypothetical protein EON63_22520 [archaeon]
MCMCINVYVVCVWLYEIECTMSNQAIAIHTGPRQHRQGVFEEMVCESVRPIHNPHPSYCSS